MGHYLPDPMTICDRFLFSKEPCDFCIRYLSALIFGDELSLTGSPGRYTYNGNEFDDEYGFDLYYYGARYMDPGLGRFTTPDPVQDFINPYSYVRNNPMNRIDPTGTASAPRTIYNMIWIDTFTQFKNDNEDIFFDVLTSITEAARKLREILAQAKEVADDLASNSLVDDKQEWADMAVLMQNMIDQLDAWNFTDLVRLTDEGRPLCAGQGYLMLNPGEFNRYMSDEKMS